MLFAAALSEPQMRDLHQTSYRGYSTPSHHGFDAAEDVDVDYLMNFGLKGFWPLDQDARDIAACAGPSPSGLCSAAGSPLDGLPQLVQVFSASIKIFRVLTLSITRSVSESKKTQIHFSNGS